MKFLYLFLVVLSFVGISVCQQPTLTSVSPNNLAIPQQGQIVPAQKIVFTGSNFRDGMIVNFNGKWYPLTVLSKTQAYWMFAQSAFPSASGNLQMNVQNTHGAASNVVGFLFCDPLPLTFTIPEIKMEVGQPVNVDLNQYLPPVKTSGCHI